MRQVILWMAGLDAALLLIALLKLALAGVHGGDAAGTGMLQGFIVVGAVFAALLLAPALWLAWTDRWLWLALTLAGLGSLVVLFVAVNALGS